MFAPACSRGRERGVRPREHASRTRQHGVGGRPARRAQDKDGPALGERLERVETQLDGFLAKHCELANSGTEMTASNWFRGTNALNGEPFGRLGLQMGAPSPRPTMADDFLDTPQCLCCYDAALDLSLIHI